MKIRRCIAGSIALLLALPAAALSQESVSTQAVRFIDGDTMIMVIDGKREWVDLLAADAPENAQPWGMVAMSALKTLVDGKDVRIEFDQQQRNPEGRMWGYLWVGDTMVNLEMIANGYALWNFWPPNTRYDDTLLDAEFQARKNRKGMWKSPAPSADDTPFN